MGAMAGDLEATAQVGKTMYAIVREAGTSVSIRIRGDAGEKTVYIPRSLLTVYCIAAITHRLSRLVTKLFTEGES